MADLGEVYDTETMELSSFDLIPNVRVVAQIISEDEKPTKTGRMLIFTFEILDGEFEGRRIWTSYNYINESAKAQGIAREQFGFIAKALGIRTYENTEAFHSLPMLVDVITEKDATGKYKDKNVIKNGGYHPITAADPTQIPSQASNNNSAPRPTSAGGSGQPDAPKQSAPPPRAAGVRPWDRQPAGAR